MFDLPFFTKMPNNLLHFNELKRYVKEYLQETKKG
jgi:hypothetical protein